jgi:hypothetical protein
MEVGESKSILGHGKSVRVQYNTADALTQVELSSALGLAIPEC